MADLEARQRAGTQERQLETARLHRLVSELRETVTALEAARETEHRDRRLATRFASTVAAATIAPLARIVTDVNLVTGAGELDERRARQLVTETRTVAFLARELQDFDDSNDADTRFDIRQLTDEAISAIAPGLPGDVERILPFYDRYGPKRFHGSESITRALVFNYLVANALHAQAHTLDLHVSYLAEGLLAFALSPRVPEHANLQHPRLARLMPLLGASLNDGILTIPAVTDDTFAQPDPMLQALIVCHDEHEQACLEARLESMRVAVASRRYDVDVCIATIDEVTETLALRDKLRPDTRLLLLGNTTPLPLPETRQMARPLLHDALSAELLEIADAGSERAPLVLAVDDNASNLKLLALQLQELGVRVETADTGAMAVALASRHDFSLIVLDVHLPDASGVDVAAAVRAKCRRDTPIVMLTARISDEDRRRLLDAGIVDVLVKPASKSRLSQLLVSLNLATHAPRAQRHPPTTANRTTLLAIFDHDLSLKLANDRADLADEILEQLVATLPSARDEINAHFETGRIDRFREALHHLHGGTQYCGLPRLKNAVAKLEAIAGTDREQEVRLALSVFNGEVDALIDWYDPGLNYFDTSILRGREDQP